MKISTKGRYALRIMVDIAKNGKENYVSINSISERQGLSNKYLEQIISKLTKAGLLVASRGHQGGYKLTRKPSEYRIGDILRVAEGDLRLVECLKDDSCSRKSICSVRNFWKGLEEVIEVYADSYTLEEFVK